MKGVNAALADAMQGVMEDNLETAKRTTRQEAVRQWGALPEDEKLRRCWASIPRSVAPSMAFAGEPVDLAMLEAAHARRPMPPLRRAECCTDVSFAPW